MSRLLGVVLVEYAVCVEIATQEIREFRSKMI